MFQSNSPQINPTQRLKEIEKSNSHVQNLIDSAKKIIYNDQILSSNEKQKLQVKISIEKDHLKNSFYKIDCFESNLKLSIVEKNFNSQPVQQISGNKINEKYNEKQQFSPFKGQIKRNINKNSSFSKNYLDSSSNLAGNNQKPSTSSQIHFSQQKNGNGHTKVTILRYIQQSNQKEIQQTQLINEKEAVKNSRCQIDLFQPLGNSKIVVTTTRETFNPAESTNYNSFIDSHKRIFQDQHKSSKFKNAQDNSKRQQTLTIPLYEQLLNLRTPEKHFQIINTQTEQHIIGEPFQSVQLSKSRNKPVKNESLLTPNSLANRQKSKLSSSQKRKDSDVSTSFKEILSRNKEKLQDSKSKQMQSKSSSPGYELHLQELYNRKEEGKRRLYGQSYMTQRREIDSSSTIKKYSIANSRRDQGQSSITRSKKDPINEKDRSRSFNSSSKSLSHSKNKPLHSGTLKLNSMPFSSQCTRCKTYSSARKQQPQEALSSYHLAKKYLTAEGQRQCYNFLKSQGIEEKDWPIFITEYVYRQLSKVYKQVSPQNQSKS